MQLFVLFLVITGAGAERKSMHPLLKICIKFYPQKSCQICERRKHSPVPLLILTCAWSQFQNGKQTSGLYGRSAWGLSGLNSCNFKNLSEISRYYSSIHIFPSYVTMAELSLFLFFHSFVLFTFYLLRTALTLIELIFWGKFK